MVFFSKKCYIVKTPHTDFFYNKKKQSYYHITNRLRLEIKGRVTTAAKGLLNEKRAQAHFQIGPAEKRTRP